MTEKSECVCFNCNSFCSDRSDFDNGFGICINDNEFDPYIDDALENSDFSCCMELYQQKRFDGGRETCPDFEEAELIDIGDIDVDADDFVDKLKIIAIYEQMKTQNVDEVVKALYSSNEVVKEKALSTLFSYMFSGNKGAFDSLLKYYMELPPVVSISDVHFRLRILQDLISSKFNNELVDAFIKELYKMPSNNTTKQLFSKMIKFLERCPLDIVEDKVIWLLKERKFSSKMEQNIISIIDRYEGL